MAFVHTVNLVTGRANEPHITSYDTAEFNKSIFGNASGAIDTPIGAEMVDYNTMRIHSGKVIMQGRLIRIEENVTVTINGEEAGMHRYDGIFLEYHKDTSTGKEWAIIAKYSGTPSESTVSPVTASAEGAEINESCTISSLRLFDVFVSGTATPQITPKCYAITLGSCKGIVACDGNGHFRPAEEGREYQAPLPFGTWTPAVSGASTYYTRSGRYAIVGNVAVIHFAVTGYCNSVIDEVIITGFPLKLDGVSAGGGVCKVVTGDVGYAFSGFRAYSSDGTSQISPYGIFGSSTISYECKYIGMKAGTFEFTGSIVAALDEQEYR